MTTNVEARPLNLWSRVSCDEPCPICGKAEWCTMSTDGTVACCMRTQSGKQLSNGGWLHRLADRPTSESSPLPRPPTLAAMNAHQAPIELRHAVYSALLRELGLSETHRRHLLDVRGLPAVALPLFASLPYLDDFTLRHILAVTVQKRVGSALSGVPGFYAQKGWQAMVKVPAGVLIPALDARGRIQALQVRADDPGEGRPRYLWLSSNPDHWPEGTASGSPVAVWRPKLASNGVWVTEGSLKGLIAACRLPACVVAVGGVAGWHAVLPILAALNVKVVIVAYDADAATKPEVEQARESLALALHRAGYIVRIAGWNPERKGIDDALLASTAIVVEDWRRRASVPRRPKHSVSLPPIVRPVGVPLAILLQGVSR